MELALYSENGYYARAVQRSGRAGDFFTSVDVGPLFGQLLAAQLAEMFAILASRAPSPESRAPSPESRAPSPEPRAPSPEPRAPSPEPRVPNPESRTPNPEFDLVEAGAADGRLAADILRAARTRHPSLYEAVRLHLVETSAVARAAQRATLGETGDCLASSSPHLPASFEGVLLANELLDALPVHQVVMREEGLREVYVDMARDVQPCDRGPAAFAPLTLRRASPELARPSRERRREGAALRLTTREGPPSTPALEDYLQRIGVTLEPGWRAEINLQAVDWIRDAARRLRRGFIIVIDYGHEARELYSPTHVQGTLTTFARHMITGPESAGAPPWLQQPGEQDITAHVDFTSVRAAAEAEGLRTLGFLDQTYFLLGILTGCRESSALGVRLESDSSLTSSANSRHLKTLLMPGGLGSTHKVLILGKGVGTPALLGCSYRQRIT